jgi:ABC-2 type transport system permease protein
MIKTLIFRTLRDQKITFFYWSLGMSLISLLLMAFWPVIESEADLMQQYMDALPEEMLAILGGTSNITTPEGYLNIELMGFIAPIVFMIYSIHLAASFIGGEEEKGTLEIILSLPIARYRFIAGKYISFVIILLIFAIMFGIVLMIGSNLFSMGIQNLFLFLASINVMVNALVIGSISFFVGAYTGKRNLAMAVGAAWGIGGNILVGLTALVDSIEPIKYLIPFYYYKGYYQDSGEDVLTDGLALLPILGLIFSAAILFLGSLIIFSRRDIK